MQKLLEYTANLVGVDLSNPYVIGDVSEIKDLPNFILFAKQNSKNMRLDYLNPLQKLNELKKMWSEEQNRTRQNTAMSEAQALAAKFRTIKTLVKNELEQGKPIDFDCLKKEGEDYFTNFEQKTLQKIGNIRLICKLDDDFKLEDEINDVFIGVIYQPKKIEKQNQKATLLALAGAKSF